MIRATAVEVQVPAQDGYLGILPGHAPLLTAMGMGELSYNDGQQTHYAVVFGGYMEVLAGRVIVLAESAERAEEINSARASASKQSAEKTLAAPGSPEEATAAMEVIARAELRLKVAGRASGAAHGAAEVAHRA